MIEINRLPLQLYNYNLDGYEMWLNKGRLNTNPWFQRPYVWTPEQEHDLIKSMLEGIPIGQVFINTWWQYREVGAPDILVDGKQRITAIFKFINNEISYEGEYFKEQSEDFQRGFMNIILPCNVTKFKKEEDVVELYNRLNFGGTPHKEEWRAKV